MEEATEFNNVSSSPKNVHRKHIEAPSTANIDDCQLSAIQHHEIGESDESLGTSPSHSLHSQDNLLLSLPDSFDDTFTLSSILQPPANGKNEQQMPSAKDGRRRTSDQIGQQILYRQEVDSHRNVPVTMEVDMLRAKLQEAGSTIRSLRSQIQIEKDNLCDVKVNDEEWTRLSQIPKDDLTLVEYACLEKETSILSERAEQAEKDCAKNDAALREALSKMDALSAELAGERESKKSEYEAKLSNEVKKIRDECDREIAEARNGSKNNWERESQLLHDAKREATNQLNRVQRELTDLRACHEAALTEHARAIATLERELANNRSDIKVKTYENANLVTTQEALKTDLKMLQTHNNSLREQVEVYQKDLFKIKQESTTERQNLTDEISKTNEQLEMYLLAELRIESKVDAGDDPGDESLLSNPKRRIQQAVALARKCAELKKSEESLRRELELQQNENEELKAKLKESAGLLADMKQPSAYVVESMRVKEEELCRLRSEKRLLQTELDTAKKERSILTQQLSAVLERRQQLEEMKSIVKDLKSQPPAEQTRKARDHDLSIHTVHRERPRPVQPTCWHTPCVAE